MIRIGPRPLPLHLMLAGQMWAGALAAQSTGPTATVWTGWKPGSTHSNNGSTGLASPCRNPRAGGRQSRADRASKEALEEALRREIDRRSARYLKGLALYRTHPYRRALADPPILWTEGTSQLFDHGAAPPAEPTDPPAPDRTVLVVPSLINRGYILDLSSENSLMRWLVARGLRPLLLEWGAPGALERSFTMTDFVAGRLERAATAACAFAGRPVPVVGYCMGGTLVAALAHRRPDLVDSAAFLATPWDFHADGTQSATMLSAGLRLLAPWFERGCPIPVDLLQALFTMIDPLVALRKYSAFADMAPDSERARAFVALEDWLNDGIDLPGAVGHACFDGWYGRNDPVRDAWLIAGAPIKPGEIGVPSLHLVADRDRLVPPASALALSTAMPGARTHRVALGHIGMIAGRSARGSVWPILGDWLLERIKALA